MVICNEAASFNRCVFKVQQDMQAQLNTLRTESKGKMSQKCLLPQMKYSTGHWSGETLISLTSGVITPRTPGKT